MNDVAGGHHPEEQPTENMTGMIDRTSRRSDFAGDRMPCQVPRRGPDRQIAPVHARVTGPTIHGRSAVQGRTGQRMASMAIWDEIGDGVLRCGAAALNPGNIATTTPAPRTTRHPKRLADWPPRRVTPPVDSRRVSRAGSRWPPDLPEPAGAQRRTQGRGNQPAEGRRDVGQLRSRLIASSTG